MKESKKLHNIDEHTSRIRKVLIVLIISVLINFGLAFLKLMVGLGTGSLCIMLDSTNSFLDVLSGIVTIIAFFFVLSGKDDDGLGYGRGEYLATFVVSAIVVGFGIAFFVKAVERFLTPVPLGWSWLEFGLMIIALVGKIGLFLMFHFTNKKFKSPAIKAMTVDSIMDIGLTTMVTISLVVSEFGDVLIDAIFGVILSTFIIGIGIRMMIDATRTLVGVDRKDDVLYLKEYLKEQEGIKDVGRAMFSDLGFENLHAVAEIQMEDDLSYEEVLEILSKIKEEVLSTYGIYLDLSPVKEIKNYKKITKWKNGKKQD